MNFKKILLIIFALFISCSVVNANILPTSSKDIPSQSIGVYQTDKIITIYKEPRKDSNIIKEIRIINPEYRESEYQNIFAVLIPAKELGYLYVTDIDEEWVEIIYDKRKLSKGWVCKNDEFQFLPWINFFNMYGRKYGLKYLKDNPDNIYELHSQSMNESKILGYTQKYREIRLTGIEGNWMLVSVLDTNYSINTGYIIWREINGSIYVFPNIK